MNRSRSELEADLARALSRHIGYTAGAYGIDRIVGITSFFEHKPSLYQFELTQHLINQSSNDRRQIKEGYAAEILNFAIGLGIIYKVADGATPRVNRFALTAEGATIKSALAKREDELIKFTLIGLVLESDCDIYGLILDIIDDQHVYGTILQEMFLERFENLARDRIKWLTASFPNRTLRDRIAKQVTWIRKDSKGYGWQYKQPSKDFGRHHVTPRVGWAKWLGHIKPGWSSSTTNGSPLTFSGTRLLHAVRGPSSRYMWLGPPSDTQDALRIPESNRRDGPWSPSWNLLRPRDFRTSSYDIQNIADEVAVFMETHYDELRLIHANQASIKSVMPFIHFIERKFGYSVQKESVLDRLFGIGSRFNLLSTRNDRYGYYQRRTR